MPVGNQKAVVYHLLKAGCHKVEPVRVVRFERTGVEPAARSYHVEKRVELFFECFRVERLLGMSARMAYVAFAAVGRVFFAEVAEHPGNAASAIIVGECRHCGELALHCGTAVFVYLFRESQLVGRYTVGGE